MAKMRPRCGRETYVATFLCARLFTQANTAAFCKGLRNFLRGPTDDAVYRSELLEMAEAGLIPRRQVDACMAAKNRPMFCLSAMSHNIRQVMWTALSAASSRLMSRLMSRPRLPP